MMPTSSRSTIGVAILALVALVDLSWLIEARLGAVSSADAPPTPVLVSFALLGLITLAATRPALRGHRTAAWVVVVSRVVSVLYAVAPAFAFGAPAWVLAVGSVVIVLTAVGIWWTAPLLRGTRAVGAGTRTVA